MVGNKAMHKSIENFVMSGSIDKQIQKFAGQNSLSNTDVNFYVDGREKNKFKIKLQATSSFGEVYLIEEEFDKSMSAKDALLLLEQKLLDIIDDHLEQEGA